VQLRPVKLVESEFCHSTGVRPHSPKVSGHAAEDPPVMLVVTEVLEDMLYPGRMGEGMMRKE
jgi:hypothetical protein